MSLNVKYGWNGTLSTCLVTPRGLFAPAWWRNKMWTRVAAAMINGSKKWKVKNRVKVAFSTANPPQIHWTKKVPTYGIAEKRFVITVAPQNDICPHGKTYPKNAVAITINKIITPTIQAWKIK